MELKLDKIDKRLLFELDRNAFISLSDLSKKLRQSKQTTSYRMKRLEKLGIIRGYKAVIDMSSLGYTTYRMYVKLQNTDKALNEDIFGLLKSMKSVWSVAVMQGKWDLAIFFGAQSTGELHDIFENIMMKFRGNIKEYSFCIYEPVHFFGRRFFMKEEIGGYELIYGGKERVRIDATDMKILEEIKNDARKRATDVARRIGISADTVVRRIRRLRKQDVIIGAKIELDYGILGYTGYRVDFYLKNYKRRKHLFEFCKKHKNIYVVNDTVGGADFEIAMAVKDHYQFTKILMEILEFFNDTISSYDYIGFSTFSFLEYIPD